MIGQPQCSVFLLEAKALPSAVNTYTAEVNPGTATMTAGTWRTGGACGQHSVLWIPVLDFMQSSFFLKECLDEYFRRLVGGLSFRSLTPAPPG